MGFSDNRKFKIRKQRQKCIAGVFKNCYIGDSCRRYFVQPEENEKDYRIISTLKNNKEYYLLLGNVNTDEICIAKFVYTSWVYLTKLSVKKVLRNKVLFKRWLKDINIKAGESKCMVKYVLRDDGKIEVRNTDYREIRRYVNPLCQPVYKSFSY